MNIKITLEAPVLPEGTSIWVDVSRQEDLDFLTKAIVKVFEEAEKSRVDLPGYRGLIERVGEIEKLALAGLQAHTKLEIANNSR